MLVLIFILSLLNDFEKSLYFMAIVVFASIVLFSSSYYKFSEPEVKSRSYEPIKKRNLEFLLPVGYLVFSLLVFFVQWRGHFGRLGLSFMVYLLELVGSTLIIPIFGYILIFMTTIYITWKIIQNRKRLKSKFIKDKMANNKSEYALLLILFILAFSVRFPSVNFTLNFPDNFYQPVLAFNMIEKGIFTYHNQIDFIPTGFNWESPSGRWYPKGGVYTILLFLSFNIFGFTDFAAYLPGIILGSLSVVLIYLIGRKTLNKEVGIISALLLAFSGWEIAMDTHIRHYVIFIMFFLLSIYLYLNYREKRSNGSFFLLLLSLSFLLQSHLQAIIPFIFIIVLLLVDIIYRNIEFVYGGLKHLSIIIIVLTPIYLILEPFTQSRVGFIQFATYHFGINYWVLIWSIVILGALKSLRNSNSTVLCLLFFMPWLILPYAIEGLERVINPRYTSIFFPLFILYLSIAVYYFSQDINKLFFKKPSLGNSKYTTSTIALALSILIVASSLNFYLPGENYTKKDIWPQRYDSASEKLSTHPFIDFKKGYNLIREGKLETNNKIIIMSDDPWTVYWYIHVNDNTRNPKIEGAWLANYGNLEKWSFELGEENYHPSTRLSYVDVSRFDLHSGLPVVNSVDELEKITQKYKEIYIIFTDFSPRAGQLYEYSKKSFNTLSKKDPEVYYWVNN